ncbi:hypothetical protein AALB52_04415 [Lachnospiraceae bacterium 38-14]
MARQCKCQITGETGTTDTFYKADNGKYYKSKEVYDIWNKENENRKKVIEKFAIDFLDYEPGQVFPTVLTKKLKELEFYGYDVINRTIDKAYNSIQYSIQHKEFKNDIGKISYIFAIIKNNINDVYKQVLREEKIKEKQKTQTDHFESISESELMNIGSKRKAKDISEFLEE